MFKVHDKERNTLVWKIWVILLIEFIGTFILVFGIIAPKAFGWTVEPESITKFGDVMYYIFFSSFIQISLYVSSLILILIFLLAKISVNLNPAVTLAEVAVGNTKWHIALPMIFIQLIAGILASLVVYELISVVGTPAAQENFENGQFSLDSVSPTFTAPKLLNNTSHNIESWAVVPPVKIEWLYALPVYIIEFLFTFALLASIVYGKDKISRNKRPFIIFLTLFVIISFGCMTSNVALNPARLLGPAIVGHIAGEGPAAETMQYQMIYLAGELSAVALVFYIESKLGKINTENSSVHKIIIGSGSGLVEVPELNELQVVTEVKKNQSSNENKSFENVDKNELIKVAKELEISIDKKDKWIDFEDRIIAYLRFWSLNCYWQFKIKWK